METLTLGDMVQLKFVGWPGDHPKSNQPLILSWNSRSVTIHAGQTKSVPFEMAKVYFGDPRSSAELMQLKDEYGNHMIIGDRRSEVIRLQSFWQAKEPVFKEFIPGDRSYITDTLSDMLPDVEVYNMEGERVHMVTDDPYGDHVTVATTTMHQQEQYRQKLVEQADEISELKRQQRELLDKLGLNPDILNPVTEPKSQDPALTTPTNPVKEEAPPMVYNPRTKRVQHKRLAPTADPTKIEDLEPDTD
jgi:hypothetical protein